MPSTSRTTPASSPIAPVKRTICVDVDGTLCTNTHGEYEQAEPFPWAIERVNALARAGHTIILFTARGTKTGIDWSELTREQLARWGVEYDELRFGKPSADLYIDDRTLTTRDWQVGDASGVPALPDDAVVPLLPLPHVSAVVESGRTFGGRAPFLARHVELALERAAGIPGLPDAAELAAQVERAVAGAEDDVVFTIALAAPPSAAFADVYEGPRGPQVSVRPLRHVQAAVAAFGWPAVRASTTGAPDAWPLTPDGRDAFGGDLVAVRDGVATIAPGPPSVAREEAERLVELHEGAIDVTSADELLVLNMPFFVVPIAELDGRPLATSFAQRLLPAGVR